MLPKAKELFEIIGLTFCVVVALTLCPIPEFVISRLLALAGGLIGAEIIIWFAMRKLHKDDKHDTINQ